jgi:hypothetical protein
LKTKKRNENKLEDKSIEKKILKQELFIQNKKKCKFTNYLLTDLVAVDVVVQAFDATDSEQSLVADSQDTLAHLAVAAVDNL